MSTNMFGGVFHDFLQGTWDEAKGFLREELEQLRTALNRKWANAFGADNTLQTVAIEGSTTNVPLYAGIEDPDGPIKWFKVNVADGVKSRLKLSNFVQATAASVLLGRRSTSAGNFEQITLGAGLTMSGTVLSSTITQAGSYIPVVTGAEPVALVSNGAGELIVVAFEP